MSITALVCKVLFVVDGDTIECDAEKIRLLGFDTPEIHASCEAEYRLAFLAKMRLKQLLEAHDLEIDRQGTDQYARTLASIYLHGHDVAADMIQEGYARICKDKFCRKSWCNQEE